MADVDYSIASKTQAPKFDPLSVATQATQLSQGVLNNRLLGQQVDSRIALGRAVTSATDPKTGEVDWSKALSGLSQDPKGSFAVPELAGQILDRQIKQQQLAGVTLDVQQKRTKMIADAAGSILGSKTPLTPEGVASTLTDNLVDSGIFKDPGAVQQFTAFVQQLKGKDDQQLRRIIGQYGQLADATLARIETQYAQQHGGITPASDAEGAPVYVPGSGGTVVPSTVLKSQRAAVMAGGAPIRSGAPQTAEGVPLPEAGRPVINGTDPNTAQPYIITAGDAARAAAAGGPGGAPQGAGVAPPHIPVGPAAGVAEGLQHQAAAGADMATRLTQRASIVPQRMAALKNMGQTLDSFQPGPKADLTYKLGALATQFGLAPPSAAKGAAAQEEFNKLAAQVALDQWGSLGGTGTNEQLGTTMKANPHEAMSKMGMKNVMALLQGNEEAISAQSSAWNRYQSKHKDDPLAYQHFQEGWNRYYDPRAFQADFMKAADLKAMEAKMSKDELAKFQQARAFATQIKGQ